MASTAYGQCNCATGHGIVVTATDECGKPTLGCSIIQSSSGVYPDESNELPGSSDFAVVDTAAYSGLPSYNTHTTTWTLQASYQWSVGYSTVECTAVDGGHHKATCRFTVNCMDRITTGAVRIQAGEASNATPHLRSLYSC